MFEMLMDLRTQIKEPDVQDDQAAADYPRPEVPNHLHKGIISTINKINAITDTRLRATRITLLVYENARLLAEVNEHRAARGYRLLPVVDPGQAK